MRTSKLDLLSDLQLCNVRADTVTYCGRRAVRLVEAEPAAEGPAIAILTRSDFRDGVIVAWVAGDRRADAPRKCAASLGSPSG